MPMPCCRGRPWDKAAAAAEAGAKGPLALALMANGDGGGGIIESGEGGGGGSGRGLHSSTFQLNLSRFWHKIHPKHPPIPHHTSYTPI